jgi:DNA-binding MarR family transcriptional regulator
MMVHMTRSSVASRPAPSGIGLDATKAGIIADFQASMGGLKCIGSERIMRLGLSMTQLHILNLVDGHGEMAMSRLAEMLDVSLSNATGLIDRVEERGFVERFRVPSDRRVVMVRLTPAGRQTLTEVETSREATFRPVLDGLDEAQLAGVALGMSALRRAVEAKMTGAERTHTHQPHGKD